MNNKNLTSRTVGTDVPRGRLASCRPLAFGVAALLAIASIPARAEDAPASGGLSATVTVVSDYVSRGVSFSDSQGTLQGSIDYAFASGLYVGTWASKYDFGTEARREVDGYLGYSRSFASEFTLDIGAAHYHFLHEPESNFNEVYLGGSCGRVDAKLWYSDNYFGTGDYQYYLETGVRVLLPRAWLLQLRGGYTFFGDGVGWESYANGQLIVSRSVYGVDVAVRATATSNDQFGDREDARLIVSVAKKFG